MSSAVGGPAGGVAGAHGSAGGDGDADMVGSEGGGESPRFRTTLVRVLAVQVVTLVLLWLLQAAYHG